MTDEEIAEEYINKNPSAKILCPFEEGRIRRVKDAILYGLTKGREEKYEMALSQIRHDREKVIEYNEQLKRENAELKKQNESLKDTLQAIATDTNEHITHNVAQNELGKWELAE